MAATVNVRLKPRSGKCAVTVRAPKDIEVSVTSPPVDNRANEQLIEYLSNVLGVAKSSVSIIKGGHSRNKVVLIENMEEGELLKRLSLL